MHRRVVYLEGTFVTAVVDVFLVLLVRIGAGHVDAGMVQMGVSIGHPVGHQFAHARRVFHPHRLGVPQTSHSGRLTYRGVAIGRYLQQAIEGVFLVIAQLGQDGRELHRPLQRRHDLLQLEIALRRGQARLFLFEDIPRVAHARVFLFVIAPFDLPAFWRFGVARVAQISRVALIPQQRVADVFAGTGKFKIGLEKREWVVYRHDRQVFARHARNQASPQTGADDDVIRGNIAFGGFYAQDAAVVDAQPGAGCIGKREQFARRHSGIDQLARHHLRTGFHQARIGVPQGTLNHVLFQQGELGFRFCGRDHLHPVAKGFTRGHAALELLHALVIANTGHFDAAYAFIAA